MQQPDPRESRNLIMAMGIVVLIVLGWGYFKPESAKEQQPQAVASQNANNDAVTTHAVQGGSEQPNAPGQSERTLAEGALESPRLEIKAPNLQGSLRQVGARLDDLVLPKYTVAYNSKDPVRLLSPENTKHAYFIDYGWVKGNTSKVTLPTPETNWQVVSGDVLTPQTPLVLSWKSPEGVLFERTFTIDDEFLVCVKDRVVNQSGTDIELAHYGQIAREHPPEDAGFAILHEGPIGYIDGGLKEPSYSDLEKGKTLLPAKGGWGGITDKYWLTSLIPNQDKSGTFTYRSVEKGGARRFLVESVENLEKISAGEAVEVTLNLFAGAKVLEILDAYEQKLHVQHLDKAVDFGKFYFLTKPMFQALTFIKEYVGNFGVAILILTVLIKLALFPVANKSFRSMARMKALKPKLDRLKELHGDDKMKFAQAQMELFKKEKVNPMAGCLPMLAQIPIFFALYKVLFISIEMRQAPFFGWIHDLSAPDPTTFFNLFGLLPFTPPSFLHIGAWPLIMGASMFLQQRMNPTPQDPVQQKMFMLMPVIFTVMLANFPAGLVIYWTWNNLLSMAQQAMIMRLEAKNAQK